MGTCTLRGVLSWFEATLICICFKENELGSTLACRPQMQSTCNCQSLRSKGTGHYLVEPMHCSTAIYSRKGYPKGISIMVIHRFFAFLQGPLDNTFQAAVGITIACILKAASSILLHPHWIGIEMLLEKFTNLIERELQGLHLTTGTCLTSACGGMLLFHCLP